MEIFLIFIVVVLVFMFLQSLSSRKRRQRQNDVLKRSMVPGAWVMTTAGFYGQFVEQDGEVVILQTVDGTETFWDQRAVARVVDEPPFATPAPKGQDEDGAAGADDAADAAEDSAAAHKDASPRQADTAAAAADAADPKVAETPDGSENPAASSKGGDADEDAEAGGATSAAKD